MEILAICYISSVLFISRNLFLVTHWNISKLRSSVFVFVFSQDNAFLSFDCSLWHTQRCIWPIFTSCKKSILMQLFTVVTKFKEGIILLHFHFMSYIVTKRQWIWCFFHILRQKTKLQFIHKQQSLGTAYDGKTYGEAEGSFPSKTLNFTFSSSALCTC